MMSREKPMSPLERGMRKLDVLMRTFGLRTRIFKGSSRAIVKGTRKTYPYEIEATVLETARGIGIRVNPDKLWYSFLKIIPFVILLGLSITQFVAPQAGKAISEGIGVNLFLTVLGYAVKPIGLFIILPLIASLVVGAEILERYIRMNYIKNRMPRFLSGAEWQVAEPPIFLDLISSSNNILWLMWVVLIIIFAPFTFSEEIVSKFVDVYNTELSALKESTIWISLFDIGIMTGIFFAIAYKQFGEFRGSLDRQQFRKDIELEWETRELLETGFGAIVVGFIELSVFSFMFWSNISIVQAIIFILITLISSQIGIWLFWQKESYNYIAIELWLFLSVVVMVFLNANNKGYSWMIICHLFLILIVLGVFLNRHFEEYLNERGIFEPSWVFNPLPLIPLVEVLKKSRTRAPKGVRRELEEIQEEDMKDKLKEKESVMLNMQKITRKGKEVEKIIQVYQKIVDRTIKTKINILSIATLKETIIQNIKEEEIIQDAEGFLETVDQLLWNDNFKLKDGKDVLEQGNRVYNYILKRG